MKYSSATAWPNQLEAILNLPECILCKYCISNNLYTFGHGWMSSEEVSLMILSIHLFTLRQENCPIKFGIQKEIQLWLEDKQLHLFNAFIFLWKAVSIPLLLALQLDNGKAFFTVYTDKQNSKMIRYLIFLSQNPLDTSLRLFLIVKGWPM